MKYLVLLICILFFTSFYTYTILSRKELAKPWIIESDRADPSTVYLVNPKLDHDGRRGDIDFFINPYTSTLRIKYVEPPGGFPICEHVIRCGTRSPIEERKPHKCFDYSKQSTCAYDASKGLLKIKDPSFLGGTLFQIQQANFKEIVLKRMK